MLRFLPLSNLPPDFIKTVMNLISEQTRTVYSIEKIADGFQISDPEIIKNNLTRCYIKGIREKGFRGTRVLDYTRIDLAKYFKAITVTLDLTHVFIVEQLCEQLHYFYGIALDPNGFNLVETIPGESVTLEAKPTNHVWFGSLIITHCVQINPVMSTNAQVVDTRPDARPYSWKLYLTNVEYLKNLSMGDYDPASVVTTLHDQTNDTWLSVPERAAYNLFGSQILYNGPNATRTNRSEQFMVVIKLHPHYCEALSGYLYLFY